MPMQGSSPQIGTLGYNLENGQSEQPYLEPVDERVIGGVEIYVAGVDDQVSSGRTLTVQESSPEHWVGRVDTNLKAYASVRLELRLPPGVSPTTVTFVVGPRVRGETLISGDGPAPRRHSSESSS